MIDMIVTLSQWYDAGKVWSNLVL